MLTIMRLVVAGIATFGHYAISHALRWTTPGWVFGLVFVGVATLLYLLFPATPAAEVRPTVLHGPYTASRAFRRRRERGRQP